MRFLLQKKAAQQRKEDALLLTELMAATAASQRSKVRNVFGEATKEKYMGVRVNNKSVEGSGLSASLSYIAVSC